MLWSWWKWVKQTAAMSLHRNSPWAPRSMLLAAPLPASTSTYLPSKCTSVQADARSRLGQGLPLPTVTTLNGAACG